MTGYVRKDTTNNIADGNVINAADLDAEFDGVQAAFNASTGHKHDGTASEGATINALGPTQDVTISATLVAPKTTNFVDIGSSGLKFKDMFLAGNASIGGTLAVTGVATFTAQPILSSLTASRAVFSDGSKGLVSNAITGTGNVVMSASPTLTGTIGGASLTLSSLTSGRVTYAGTSGLLQDSANLTFNGTTLTANTLNLTNALGTTYGGTGLTSFTANGVVYASSSSVLATGSALTYDGTGLVVGSVSTYKGLGLYTSTASARPTINLINLNTANKASYIQDSSAGELIFGQMNYDLGGQVEGMRLTSTGLGIGTSSPAYKLDVSTTSANATQINKAASDGYFVQYNEASTLVGYIYSSTGSSNPFRIGAGSPKPLSLETGGVSRVLIDSSGNLGLGVTPSAWVAYKALQVGSTGGALSSSSSSDFEITTNAYYSGGWLSQGAGVASSRYRLLAGAHAWFNAPSGTAGNAITFTQAMTLNASGNLGIGTTSPGYRLQVGAAFSNDRLFIPSSYGPSGTYIGPSSSNSGAQVELATHSSATQALSWKISHDTDTTASGNLVFSCSGTPSTTYGGFSYTERMRIDASGNLMLGTTSAGGRLTVNTTGAAASTLASFTQTTNGTSFAINSPASSGQYMWTSSAGDTVLRADANSLCIATASAIKIGTPSTEWAQFISPGVFGLGLTPYPATGGGYGSGSYGYLQVGPVGAALPTGDSNVPAGRAYAHFLGGAYSSWLLLRGPYADASAKSGILLQDTFYDNTGYGGRYIQATGQALTFGATYNGTIYSSNSTLSEQMRLDPLGNLLVGTTSSDTAASSIIIQRSGTTAAGGAYLVIKNQNGAQATAGTLTPAGGILFSTYRDVRDPSYTAGITCTAVGVGGTNTGAVLIFRTTSGAGGNFTNEGNSALPDERMRLDSSGNLLVGRTAASDTTVGFTAYSNGTVTCARSSSVNGDLNLYVYSTGAGAARFYVGMGGTVYATSTTITAISDVRLKENIRDLDDGLNAVMALKPRKFDWKAGKGKDKKDDRGWIAQEFGQVFPDMVDTWADPAPEGEEPYKAVNADLIPTLVKAIQEQQALIQSLTDRITQLENKL